MSPPVLVINPGSTTTKVAVFEDGQEVLNVEAAPPRAELEKTATLDQLPARLSVVEKCLAEAGLNLADFAAVAARGAPLEPVPAGTYRVNAAMLADAASDRFVDHASRLGPIMADRLAGKHAFVVDPVSVDEYEPTARVSGLPELPRRSLTHALNIRAAARRWAAGAGRSLEDVNLLIAHLGGGVSVAALRAGRMVDSADANGEGPMSPERSGGLRVDDLVDLCFSGRHSRDELKRRLTRGAGLVGHLGTADAIEVEKRIAGGDEEAARIYEALAYGVSKHIAALAAALAGRVDAVILTGGLARSELLTGWISARVGFLGEVAVYPGQDEMRALYEGAQRVLSGAERARIYPGGEEEEE